MNRHSLAVFLPLLPALASGVPAGAAETPRLTLDLIAVPLPALRHAFCSWLAMIGENMEDIAQWLVHASPMTTRKYYAHLTPNGRANVEANRRLAYTIRSLLFSKALGENKKARA